MHADTEFTLNEKQWWQPQFQLYLVPSPTAENWVSQYSLLCCSFSENDAMYAVPISSNFLPMANLLFPPLHIGMAQQHFLGGVLHICPACFAH